MAAWLGLTFELKTAIQALKKEKTLSNDESKLLVTEVVIKGTKLVLDFDRNYSVEFATIVADLVETMLACDKRHYDLLTTCFRCLRNAYADGRTPLLSHKAESLTVSLLFFLHEELKHSNETNLPMLRCGLQLLSNATNSSELLRKTLWIPAKRVAKAFLEYEDKLSYYASMFYFNLVKANTHATLEEIDVVKVLFVGVHHDLEFCLYALELAVREGEFWAKVYSQLSEADQSSSLDILHSCLEAGKSVNVQVMEQAILHFKYCADSVLLTCESAPQNFQPLQGTKFLDILCLASTSELYQRFLQANTTLLLDAISLLKSIHALGKAGHSHFAISDELTAFDVNSTENEILQRHPAYGFRRDLIRLVGNLCYQHKRNQDQVRELEAIVPILESCNLDARNPFIMQWAVLAIRNLCEDNVSNQELIGSLAAQGVVQPAILQSSNYAVQATKTGLRLSLTKDSSDPKS